MTTEVIKSKNGDMYRVVSKRPVRDTVICAEDITNLKIALAMCKTLEEFLGAV